MVRHDFSNGGFVVHKMPAPHGSKARHFSAWFNINGDIIDAEGFYRDGKTRSATAAQKAYLQNALKPRKTESIA